MEFRIWNKERRQADETRLKKSRFVILDSLFHQCKSARRGFTLVELLVVLAVTGILTAIVITSASASKASARDLRRISDMKEIQLALAVYYDVKKEYPIEDTSNYTAPLLVSGGYISVWPSDPSASGSGYRYKRDSSKKKYCLGVVLESKNPTDIEDNSTNPSCVITTTGFNPSQFYKIWR